MATPVRFERAECASPRTAAVSRAKAHRTQPVSQSICWGTNTQESSGPVAGLPANVPMTFRVNKTVFCNFYLMWLVRRIRFFLSLGFVAPSARHICSHAIAREISAPSGRHHPPVFQNMPLLNGA